MLGTVKWFNEEKGFGFITSEDGKDYFIHFSAIEAEGFKKLSEGETVEFSPETSSKGGIAVNVRKRG